MYYTRRRQLVVLLSLSLFSASRSIRRPFLAKHAVHDSWPSRSVQIRGGDDVADVDAQDANAPSVKDSIDVNVVTAADEEASQGLPTLDQSETLAETEVESSQILDEQSSDEQTLMIDETIAAAVDESVQAEIEDLRRKATEKRAEGKSHHDSGDLASASEAFRQAATLLQEALCLDDIEQIAEECATCRLHEALCLFKNGMAQQSVQVCSEVLGDGVVVESAVLGETIGDNVDTVSIDEEAGPDGIGNDVEIGSNELAVDHADQEKETDISNHSTQSSHKSQISSQVRARAHLRRSKARLSLGDLDGAIEDAKKSAFMGDRNAVTFYGRLLREGTAANDPVVNSLEVGSSPWGNGDARNSFLEGMMGGLGNNPFSSSNTGSDFSSLLTGSNGMGLLGDLLSPPSQPDGKFRRRKKKNGIDSLAKSVLSNVMKRIEDKDTQKSICNYLHSTNTRQIMSFATMAGIPMKEESAAKLVGIANSVTPKGIRRSIRNVKRGLKVVKTTRKIFKVIDKYKTVLVLFMLCCWVRSAITQPFPVSVDKRRARKLLKEASSVVMN